MAKHKAITIELTSAQLAQLAPVFKAQKRTGQGAAIMGQIFEDGLRLVVVDAGIAVAINVAIAEARGKKPRPMRLVQSVHELGKGKRRKCLDAQTSDFEKCKAEVVAMAKEIRHNGTAERLNACETFRELTLVVRDLEDEYWKRGWVKKIDPVADRIWIEAGKPRGF